MAYDYPALLKRAKDRLPESAKHSGERFEIPKVTGHLQGSKTVISNFAQIVDALHREPQHLLKYLQRELASPAEIEGPRLVLKRKISASQINAKIVQYANEFVLCPDCKKPDTKLVKEDRFLYLRCTACGAKHPIKSRI